MRGANKQCRERSSLECMHKALSLAVLLSRLRVRPRRRRRRTAVLHLQEFLLLTLPEVCHPTHQDVAAGCTLGWAVARDRRPRIKCGGKDSAAGTSEEDVPTFRCVDKWARCGQVAGGRWVWYKEVQSRSEAGAEDGCIETVGRQWMASTSANEPQGCPVSARRGVRDDKAKDGH